MGMTISELLRKAEFWAALFGALAAFLLGAIGRWWSQNSARQANGNIALITLSQMYAMIENIRQHFLVNEATRAAEQLGADPFTFQLRPAIGIPEQNLSLQLNHLGFLANSHDPDVLNRLLTVERQYTSMLDLVRRHREVQMTLQERLSKVDPAGSQLISVGRLRELVGGMLLHQIDDVVNGLETGLAKTRDNIMEVSKQLLGVLRMQFPARRFVSYVPSPWDRVADRTRDLPNAELWRRLARRTMDFLVKRRAIGRSAANPLASEFDEPAPRRIRRVTSP
jgi:hypothetical protein